MKRNWVLAGLVVDCWFTIMTAFFSPFWSGFLTSSLVTGARGMALHPVGRLVGQVLGMICVRLAWFGFGLESSILLSPSSIEYTLQSSV